MSISGHTDMRHGSTEPGQNTAETSIIGYADEVLSQKHYGGADEREHPGFDVSELAYSQKYAAHERDYAHACHICAEGESGRISNDIASSPKRVRDAPYLVVFGAMCVFGSTALVLTGPFPLNFAFGAAAMAPLAYALAKKFMARRAGPTTP